MAHQFEKDSKKLLRVQEVARRMQAGARTVRTAIANGELRAVVIDGRGTLRVAESDYEAYLEVLAANRAEKQAKFTARRKKRKTDAGNGS